MAPAPTSAGAARGSAPKIALALPSSMTPSAIVLMKTATGGRPISGKAPHEITRLGIARTFQNIRLFGNMSALDNVLVGMHTQLKAGLFAALVRPPSAVREEREAVAAEVGERSPSCNGTRSALHLLLLS